MCFKVVVREGVEKMKDLLKTTTVIAAAVALIAAPALAKPLISKKSKPPTPAATLIKCDKGKKSYTLKTLQSSTSRKDKLEQRYFTQVRVKVEKSSSSLNRASYKWETISTTKWRDIPNRSRSVLSTTPVKVSNVDAGTSVRERVMFRWSYKSKGKARKKSVTSLSGTYKYSKFKGRGICKM